MAKRKRGDNAVKTTAPNRIYFSADTEKAIIEYNKTQDPEKREQIFRDSIQYPLNKLAENIINRFKFPYIDNNFNDLKDQVVSFLVLNLHKFSENKGKAFSYFSVIAKNYLILNNNNRYKYERRAVYYQDSADDGVSVEDYLSHDTSAEESRKDTSEFIRLMLEFWDHNLTRIFKKKKDIEIADSVLELFRRAEGIENFNKKALYLMVREMTGHKTSSITKVVNKMSSYVQRHLNEYRHYGTITDQSKYFTYKK